MGFAKLTKIVVAVIAVSTMLTSVASAQPFQKPLRWLGEGFSAGYHRCNPGPNTDYYNPWNRHNSMLISKLPQFQNQSFQSFNLNNLHSRPVYQGEPFSEYAAPSGFNQGFGAHGYNQGGHDFYNAPDQGSYHGESVQSTFEPFDASEEDEFEDEDLEEWDEDDNEWSEEEPEAEAEDDSANFESSAPGQSVFSKSSYSNQIEPALEGSVQEPNLFNPFPGH